jgi:hypothetical protein
MPGPLARIDVGLKGYRARGLVAEEATVARQRSLRPSLGGEPGLSPRLEPIAVGALASVGSALHVGIERGVTARGALAEVPPARATFRPAVGVALVRGHGHW